MIFISHASADMPVVSLISDTILKAAFRIANNDIFFSSESETGMDGGDYINGKIFKKIDESNYIEKLDEIFSLISRDAVNAVRLRCVKYVQNLRGLCYKTVA